MPSLNNKKSFMCTILLIIGFTLHIDIYKIQEPIRRISTTSPADPTAPFFKPGGGPMAPLAKLVIQVNVHTEKRSNRPLLTVETEANGDSKSTNERGPSCRYKRFLSCLGCFSRPSTTPFFSHCTLFRLICHHCPASWAGSRAGSLVS
jgi:hypothetical protein